MPTQRVREYASDLSVRSDGDRIVLTTYAEHNNTWNKALGTHETTLVLSTAQAVQLRQALAAALKGDI